MELEKIVFTEKEAAAYIGMSMSFLRKARMNGSRPGGVTAPRFYKIGKKSVRYLRSELDRYLYSFQQYDHLAQAYDK
ncbi:MAG: DNA-binding protein [Gammaproteobacteria bacterium]|nr:DNA-binding protein [Gammaproteobacteria bacterium]